MCLPTEGTAVRAILSAGLWVFLLAVSRPMTVVAQTDGDSVQAVTCEKLKALLATYPPAREMRWYVINHNGDFDAFLDKGLTYASRFEVYITVTRQRTIWIRVYPQVLGEHVNLDNVRDPNGLARLLLRLSYHNFFFWGADDSADLFAGYQFTLESGFPEEAIKEVIKSIPLIDDSVGDINSFIE